jgi:hypothetical protein
MAEDLTSAELPAVVTPRAEPAPVPMRPHRRRFLTVYGLLGAVLGVAVALVVIYGGRAITPAAKWSTWKPSGGGLGAAKQIAEQVGKSYHLSNGDQLVDVIPKTPSLPGSNGGTVPINYYAIQTAKGLVTSSFPVSSSSSVMYTLCGLGAACSIPSGTPSVARGTLVRREILELALYTFKYVSGVNSVVAFMPPKDGAESTPHYAILLQKSTLKSELDQPLTDTLRAKPPLASAIPANEVHAINATTESQIYTFGVSQLPTNELVLVLRPVPA